MLNLTTFAKILEDAGFGVMGKDIFVNTSPNVSECILILDQTYGNTVNPQLPNYYNDSGFQIIVRNKQFEKAKEIAYNIMEILKIEKSKQVDNLWVNYCYAKHLPRSYARSDGNICESSVNFALNYVDKE